MASEYASHSEVEPLERSPFAESLKCVFRTRRRESASRRRIRRYAGPVKFDEDNEREDRNLLQCLDKSVLRFRVNAVHRSQVFRPVPLFVLPPVHLAVLPPVHLLWSLLMNVSE